MRKIEVILVFLLIVTGCSVIKKGGNASKEIPNDLSQDHLIKNTKEQNLTREGFYITKAEIVVSEQKSSQKLLANIKYQRPDKYLISIKSKTGIEAARIFISEDTILINDRINRNLYYGSTFYLSEKYGVTTSLLPLIFGDCIGISNKENNEPECIKGIVSLEGLINGIIIGYNIDCRKAKAIKAITQNSFGEKAIEISYGNFFKEKDILIPKQIEIKDIQRKNSIQIRIRKIKLRWTGLIEFIPGSRYDKIKLQ